jgi:hypothetical protein
MVSKRVLARLLVAVGIGVSSVVVAASPAGAAATAVPVCTNWKQSGKIKVPVSSSGSTNCWMQRGHITRGVWMLQYSINMCYGTYLDSIGFPWDIDEDGDFGPITYAALREVQKLEDRRNPWGVDVVDDGIYGYVTAHVMFHSTGVDYNCYRL